ncbi:MAG TPA: SH3 domain-containing protein [Candidatus Binatia bacterium]|nr:SH3 domain-containing protein [Candidatus Binatia bacterium]
MEKLVRRSQRISTRSKIILALGIVVFATGVFLMGGEKKRSESQVLLEEKIQELQAKEQRVQTLEAELEKVRRELKDNSNHLAELKTKLEESQKNLATTQTRLGQATREMDRLASSRPQAAAKTSSRRTGAASSSPAPARRAAEPGSYETLRPTSVHAEPSESSRVVSQIRRGTRVTVVRSVGDWLEVKSKYGNPPGFIRSDDTMFVGAAN